MATTAARTRSRLFAVQHLDARSRLGRCAGFAEQLELFDTLPGHEETIAIMEKAARATCDFCIAHTPPDGIPYWDTGAPGLAQPGRLARRPADPYNPARAAWTAPPPPSVRKGCSASGPPLEATIAISRRACRSATPLFDEPHLSTRTRTTRD